MLQRSMYGFLCLLLAGTAPPCAVALPAQDADGRAQDADGGDDVAAELRVMTYNIRYGSAKDGDDAWPERRELALEVIEDFRPDVVGLQEALRFQLDEIGARFPRFAEIGVGRDDGARAGEYAAVLYDRRRLQALEHGTFWLSDTPEVVGSTSWGNRITRIVTWARFRDRAATESGSAAGGDATFYVFNTHWDHESQASRERSAELLLRRVAGRDRTDAPVLVTGDFNAGEDNPAFARLVGEAGAGELFDTFRAIHPDATAVGTFHGFEGGRDGDKIDAVLASPGWSVRDARILRGNVDGRYPSDHYPVTAIVAPAGDESRPAGGGTG